MSLCRLDRLSGLELASMLDVLQELLCEGFVLVGLFEFRLGM